MSALVSLPLEDLLLILEAARRVPDLEKDLNQLKNRYDGLCLMYSEILEALRR